MIKQCLIYFGNVVNEGGGQFTLQAGTRPSRATINTRLGATYPQIGLMRITDGFIWRDFPNCRVVRHTIKPMGASGRMREIVIEDRRWAWAEPRIWGEYNEIVDGGRSTINKKSARELASLCMEAMKETGYDVSALPDDVYPSVSWDAEVAADALDAVCQQFGFIVALQPSTNRAKVCKNNSGVRPSVDARAMNSTPSAEPKIVPPSLIFEGGHTLWQRDLLLEPVGIETLENKEVIKTIDALSYKPADGWEKQDPRSFKGVAKEHRGLAKRCVYRMFRVKPPFTLQPPPASPFGAVRDFTIDRDELWRILPLKKVQLSSVSNPDSDRSREALLLGAFVGRESVRKNNVDKDAYQFTDPNIQLPADNDPDVDKLVYNGGWSFNASTGLVHSQAPLYYLEGGEAKPPYLRLRTSFGVRNRATKQFVSQQYTQQVGSPTSGATQPILVKQSDVVFEIEEGRGAAASGATGLRESITNVDQFVGIAQAYLAEKMASLYPDEAITIPYKGFVFDWEVDGSIQSITWASGPQGGTTVVDYAIERPEMRLTHTQLRNQANQALAARQQVEASKRLTALLNSTT